MWVPEGIGITSHSQPMRIACRGPASLEEMETKPGLLETHWGLGTTFNLWWASKSPCGSTKSSASAVQVLKWAAAIHFCKPGTPAPCCNTLTPSPSSPAAGEPVELHKGSMWLETSAREPSRVLGFFLHFPLLWELANEEKGSWGTIQWVRDMWSLVSDVNYTETIGWGKPFHFFHFHHCCQCWKPKALFIAHLQLTFC